MEKWNIAGALIPLTGGHRHTVFRTVGLEQDVVFKSTQRSHAALAWLDKVHARARDAGFIVPRMMESSGGALIEDGWICEPFVAGQHIDADALPNIKPNLVRFHEAVASLEQRPGFQSSIALRDHAAGGDVDLDAMPGDLVRRCRAAWDAVADRRQGVIHGDLNSGNVLKTEDGQIALIDWDESRRDLLLFDTGHVDPDDTAGQAARRAWEIACSWVVEPDYARRLADRF